MKDKSEAARILLDAGWTLDEVNAVLSVPAAEPAWPPYWPSPYWQAPPTAPVPWWQQPTTWSDSTTTKDLTITYR